MAGFVAFGDLVIGAAAFIAGVYFADTVKKPVFAVIDFAKKAYAWIAAKF